ncbi:MAG: protein kinase [Candidatus Latescibacterota bacterium]|nr:MAG: protein kinase [Candidatus Latescibacterota bacterium]
MIGTTIAHYKIVDRLGGGGMGVVYKAEDTKLKRTVALKILTREKGVSERDKRRFLQEARAAAALRHPNICTVFEIGEEDGLSYITMAYVPGRSLKQIIDGGLLPIERVLDIAIQIAKGLREAHDKGVVHRDIKSANIMIDDDGRATILDFGLARLAGQSQVTKEGSTVGTVTYMSPEQAQAGDVDHRTDIWALGVCMYEMITGTLPFQGDHDSVILYQIVNESPPPMADARPDIPVMVRQIAQKAMDKDPDKRYQHAAGMLADLNTAVKKIKTGIAATVSEPSIAVLPFANMSADENQEYFCDGMAEEIINSLTQIEGLRVTSRTSSFAYKGVNIDIRDIGRKLGVETVLEGSVQKAGKRLRITAQLVNVADGYHLWSKRYDRDLEDVFTIQEEIAEKIVDALKGRLTEQEKKTIERVPTKDVGAYDFYIRGRQYFHGLGGKGLEYARNMFTSAIIEDPQYALAYCGLADCYSMIYMYYDSNKTIIENAMTASRKALRLNAELAEAHASHGLALSLDGRYEEAEQAFERAIEISPKLFEAHYYYARACRAQGKLERAVELFANASALRPEDYQSPILMADTYRGLKNRDAMLDAFRHGHAIARKHLELHPDDARACYLGAHALLELDERDKAIEWNEHAMKLAPYDPATLYNSACLFAVMGETDKTFESLAKAIDCGFSHRDWLENDPDFERIREDPRYKTLLAKIS